MGQNEEFDDDIENKETTEEKQLEEQPEPTKVEGKPSTPQVQGPTEPGVEGEKHEENVDETKADKKASKKGKKDKKKKSFDAMADEPIKFAKIGFEQALTPEEKQAKKEKKKLAKLEKQSAKEGKSSSKTKISKQPKEDKETQPSAEEPQVEAVEEKPTETEKVKKQEKPKTEKPKSPKKSEKSTDEATEKKPKKEKKLKEEKQKSPKATEESKEVLPVEEVTEQDQVQSSTQIKDAKRKHTKSKDKMETTEEVRSSTQIKGAKRKQTKSKDKMETTEEEPKLEPEKSQEKVKKKPPEENEATAEEQKTTGGKQKKSKKKSREKETKVEEKSKSKSEVALSQAESTVKFSESMVDAEESQEGIRKSKAKKAKSASKTGFSSTTVGMDESGMEPKNVCMWNQKDLEENLCEECTKNITVHSGSLLKGQKKRRKKSKASKSDIDFDKTASSVYDLATYSSKFSKSGMFSKSGIFSKSGLFSKSVLFGSSKSAISLSDGSYSSDEEEDVTSVSKAGKKRRKGKDKKDKPETQVVVISDQVTEEEPEEVAEPQKKEKGKGKGKGKGKAKGKKKEKEVVETPKEEEKPPEVDIMAEINRLKAQAEAEAKGEGVETVEAAEVKELKQKKPPKKKKKEKVKMTAELAEKIRVEAEAEAKRQAELERVRLEEEKKAAIEKDKREVVDQQTRMEQFAKATKFLDKLTEYNLDIIRKEKEEKEWNLYVNCGYLPNPSKCDAMNTYLHLWEKVLEKTTIQEASKRTADVIKLLNDLDELIDTVMEEEKDKLENWKWVRLLFREHQWESLDVATYILLRNVHKHLNRINIPTADYHFKDEHTTLGLWLRVQLPIPLPNPRRPPKPRIEVEFPEMNMNILFPLIISCENMAIRAMYLKYDHLSDLSQSYAAPEIPEVYKQDLAEYTKREWRKKLLYKYKNRVKASENIKPPQEGQSEETVENKEEPSTPPPPPEPEDFASDEEIPLVPYRKLEPTPSEMVISEEDAMYSEMRQNLLTTVEDDVINLRKYTMLGGVYMLNLVYQPPQPQEFITMDMNITPLKIPKKLELVSFYVEYVPPAPPEAGVRRLPEEIEEELKKQEEEMDKLMYITLTWPQHVIFLELPLVAHWDEDRKLWTRKDIHDLKHNEEKGTLSFRTGRFGTMALATPRYANLPYQAWELKPEADESITFQLTAAVLMLEFNIKEGALCITQLQNSPNNALQDEVGKYYKLHQLIRIMKNAGVDIFPAYDAFCYMEGTCEKLWPMEKRVYYNMAQLSVNFNFAWSRWNFPAGRRNIVMQMREFRTDKQKQKNHSMLLVTPLKAAFVDCTEVSQTFNEEEVDTVKFSSDLFNLVLATSPIAVRNKVKNTPFELTYTLAELLIAVRMLSFS